MSDSAVDTVSRHAQWRIDDLGSFAYRTANTFKLGPWNWYLLVEKHRILVLKFYPEDSAFTKESPPTASFIISVASVAGGCWKTLKHPEITDKQLKSSDYFVWEVNVPLTGRLIINVEFLDLKTTSPRGDRPHSIWADGPAQKTSNKTALSALAKMLEEGIHTDIIINASDGSIGAHRAVLASQSPVFRSMFSYNLKEEELSAIDLSNMSIEACKTFLNYIYGNIRHEDFLTHRLELLHAADKYDISELKEVCHESLLEDINSTNVLGRLQYASLYQLPKLKTGCMKYLVKLGKIFDVQDEFPSFLHTVDGELVAEIFDEVLSSWRDF